MISAFCLHLEHLFLFAFCLHLNAEKNTDIKVKNVGFVLEPAAGAAARTAAGAAAGAG